MKKQGIVLMIVVLVFSVFVLAKPDFVETEVTNEILDKIMEHDEIKTELEKLKAGFNFDNFNYYEMEELVSAERPDWGKKWKKAS